jgi:hypothetical protein
MLAETVVGERTAGSNSLVPLDTLGGLAKASIAVGDKSLDKAEQHYKSAGLYLSEAKERVARTKNLTWPGYLIQHCPIGRRQADLYIEMAEGRTSLAEVRSDGNDRAAKFSEANRAARSGVSNAQSFGNHQQKQQQQEENIAAGNNQESAPRKHVNIPPDPLLKQRNIVTLTMRDFDLPKTTLLANYALKLKGTSLN